MDHVVKKLLVERERVQVGHVLPFLEVQRDKRRFYEAAGSGAL
jgi:hypothetical protein